MLDYREIEYHQIDSRICEQFVKIDPLRPYSFQVLQKYISRISSESLKELLYSLNKIAIEEGLEDLEKLRQDKHGSGDQYSLPDKQFTGMGLHKRILSSAQPFAGRDQWIYFSRLYKRRQKDLFQNQQYKNRRQAKGFVFEAVIRFHQEYQSGFQCDKKMHDYDYSINAMALVFALERLLDLMRQVYSMTFRREVKGEKAPNEDKIFSIYELHTDIIVNRIQCQGNDCDGTGKVGVKKEN